MASTPNPQTPPNLQQQYRAGLLADFFARTPADLSESLRHAQARPLDRVALSGALRQYAAETLLSSAPKTTWFKAAAQKLEQQLELLALPHSATVVTGQQAGLLGGPAYSVHKAADALLLAQDLSTEDAPVLPVFWIASQDHDSAEVAFTHLLDLSETEFHPALDLPQGMPVGRITWQQEWTEQVRALLTEFDAPQPHKDWLNERLEYALQGQSYADVFARLIFALLGERGLILLDPLHPALAALMAGAIERELLAPLSGPESIEDAAKRLEALGYTPQLRRPAGATNLFLEEEGGQRTLLRYDGKQFSADKPYTLPQLQAILKADPSRITPAAGLRPIIQDTLLPTAAFVLGPGELAYAAELKQVYTLHGLTQPTLWPRLSVTWLEPNVARILGRYGLSAAEFQRGPEQTIGAVLAQEQQVSAVSLERLSELEAQFAALTQELTELDPTLRASVERTREATLRRLERHRLQGISALARQEEVRTGHLTRLRKHLLPRNHPQEREMSFLTYLLKHGPKPLDLLFEQQAGAVVEVVIP